jgi:hypothetical protein
MISAGFEPAIPAIERPQTTPQTARPRGSQLHLRDIFIAVVLPMFVVRALHYVCICQPNISAILIVC